MPRTALLFVSLLIACSSDRDPPSASLDAAAPLDDASAPNDDAAMSECRGALPLRCGDRVDDSTFVQAQDQWSGYACSARAESGPEKIYAFRGEERCQVSVRMTDLATDLDLFALDGCDPSIRCLDQSATPLDLQSVEVLGFDAEPARDYVVVVDGYGDATGSYTLAVDCLCGEGGASLDEGEWVLEVDRHWVDEDGITTPLTELPEEDYQLVVDGASHSVRFIGALHSVSIGSAPWIGEPMVSTKPNTITYALDDGTFAGGHFIVWVSSEGGLQAELTLYGSGVPITSSERGALVPKP